MVNIDTSRNERIPILMDMVAALSRADDPRDVLREFSRGFLKIYNLDVVTIPTNLPLVRKDHVDTVYRTEPEKWKAIVEEIGTVTETGQPILVGTTSVDNSEKLSAMLSLGAPDGTRITR